MTGLQLQASAGISLGDITDLVDGAVDQLRPQSDPRPFYLSRAATVTADGVKTQFILPVGTPPTGSLWQVRWVTTFGVDPYTPLGDYETIGGVADTFAPLQAAMYAGDPTTSPSMAMVMLVGLTFPVTRYVPDTTMWCHPNQTLFLVTGTASGVTYVPSAGQQIGCTVGIEEWRECDVSRNSGR